MLYSEPVFNQQELYAVPELASDQDTLIIEHEMSPIRNKEHTGIIRRHRYFAPTENQ